MIGANLTEWRFGQALQQLRHAAQMGLVDPEIGTIGKQGQLLAEHCMRLTPPRNKKQGENAVARDITRVVVGREAGYLESVVDITGTTTNVRQHLRNKKGQTYLIDIDQIDQSGDMIPGWHKAARDPRGRVLRAVSKSNDKVIGRWKADDVLWTTISALSAYIKKIQSRVGWAKAGWLKGYLSLGGLRAPDWVQRHGMARGVFIDGRMNASRPFVEVRNNTGWGKYRQNADRVVADAMKARERAMVSYFNAMMRLASRGINTPWQTLRTQIGAQFDRAA